MRALTIEDISGDSISVRVVNTSHVYKINLKKAVRFSDIEGMENDELMLIGIIAGKLAREHADLICEYDFENLPITGNLRLKQINFGQDVTFIEDETRLLTVTCAEMLSNLDLINRIAQDLAFYIGFLHGAFSLSEDDLTLRHPSIAIA